ncbi:MAG: hypothetical protein V1921_05415 [Candidatus Altiarchaeota archaeon]
MKFNTCLVIIMVGVVLTAGCNEGTPASTTTTLKPCETLGQPDKDKCLIDYASETGNVSVCDDVSVDLWRDNCIREVAFVTDNPSTCTQVKNTYEADECFKFLAQKLKNSRICLRISEEVKRDECYFSAAIYEKRNETCESINANSSKFRCLAIINTDSNYCALIENQNGRDWCYQKVLDCGKINSTRVIDQCYLVVAPKKFDPQVCNLISDSDVRNQCYKDVDMAESRRKSLEKSIRDSLGNESVNVTVLPKD